MGAQFSLHGFGPGGYEIEVRSLDRRAHATVWFERDGQRREVFLDLEAGPPIERSELRCLVTLDGLPVVKRRVGYSVNYTDDSKVAGVEDTDRSGQFVLKTPGLFPGSSVTFSFPRSAAVTHRFDESVSHAVIEVAFETAIAEAALLLLSETGVPLPDASVSLRSAGTFIYGAPSARAYRTGSDGRCSLDDLPGGEYDGTVTIRAYVKQGKAFGARKHRFKLTLPPRAERGREYVEVVPGLGRILRLLPVTAPGNEFPCWRLLALSRPVQSGGLPSWQDESFSTPDGILIAGLPDEPVEFLAIARDVDPRHGEWLDQMGRVVYEPGSSKVEYEVHLEPAIRTLPLVLESSKGQPLDGRPGAIGYIPIPDYQDPDLALKATTQALHSLVLRRADGRTVLRIFRALLPHPGRIVTPEGSAEVSFDELLDVSVAHFRLR